MDEKNRKSLCLKQNKLKCEEKQEKRNALRNIILF